MKPTKCPTKEKKWGKESEKMREERKRKVKVKTVVSLLNPQNSKFCFLRMPEHRKLIFYIWIRRPRRVRPVNGFVVKLQNTFFGKSLGANGLSGVKISVRVWYHDFVAIGNAWDITRFTSNHERVCDITWLWDNEERERFHEGKYVVCEQALHLESRASGTWEETLSRAAGLQDKVHLCDKNNGCHSRFFFPSATGHPTGNRFLATCSPQL